MSLNKINFSDGIRPEEIQENFEMLQEQINRERLGVGGYGLSYGFDITTHISNTDFYITVEEASIVNEKGEELYIPGAKIDIELPELYTAIEHVTIGYNNTVDLKHIPYSITRQHPAEHVPRDSKYTGIFINYPSNNYNTDDYIRVSNISGTILTVTGAIAREVVVRYYYTADRIDMVYLKDDNTIAVCKGGTSSSPSYPTAPADCKYIIAYLAIESRYSDENHIIPQAYMYVKEEAASKRNLYTDKNNDLWLCGTKFDDLQIIHMVEPKNPKENTLWLSTIDNTLYCWRSTDSFAYRNEIVVEKDLIESSVRSFYTFMDYAVDKDELEVYRNGDKLLKNIHYYEMYDGEISYTQDVPEGATSNEFAIIDKNTELKAGDKLLYIINYKDSHYMWIPVNKMSYVNAKNYRAYYTNDYAPEGESGYFDSSRARAMGGDDYEYKYQYFIFHKDEDLEMHYTPGRNELSILINQMILHNDQFEELTVNDLLRMDAEHPVRKTAASFYKWTTQELLKLSEDYDNIGIGFKLVEPLDSGLNASFQSYDKADGSNDLYVEAIVEHRICTTPMKRKFQRTATFVAEETLTVDEQIKETGIIHLPEGEIYRYDENQLEVFINGKKIVGASGFYERIHDEETNTFKSYMFNVVPEYTEEFGYYIQSPIEGVEDKIHLPLCEEYKDQSDFIKNKARSCTMFKVLSNLNVGDNITYRITTNIYSYDHINEMFDNLEAKINVDIRSLAATKESYEKYKEDINAQVLEIKREVLNMSNEIGELVNRPAVDKDTVFAPYNMPPSLMNRTMSKTINKAVIKEDIIDGYIRLNDIKVKDTDYINLILRTDSGDRYMILNVDYTIMDSTAGKTSLIQILNEEFLNLDDFTIYITGIVFGWDGNEN